MIETAYDMINIDSTFMTLRGDVCMLLAYLP